MFAVGPSPRGPPHGDRDRPGLDGVAKAFISPSTLFPKMCSKSVSDDDSEDEAAAPLLSRWFGGLRQLYRPVTVATAAAVLTAGLFLPRLKGLLPVLAERNEYRVPATEIEITPPPHWVPHDLVAQVVEHSDLAKDLSLLD